MRWSLDLVRRFPTTAVAGPEGALAWDLDAAARGDPPRLDPGRTAGTAGLRRHRRVGSRLRPHRPRWAACRPGPRLPLLAHRWCDGGGGVSPRSSVHLWDHRDPVPPVQHAVPAGVRSGDERLPRRRRLAHGARPREPPAVREHHQRHHQRQHDPDVGRRSEIVERRPDRRRRPTPDSAPAPPRARHRGSARCTGWRTRSMGSR